MEEVDFGDDGTDGGDPIADLVAQVKLLMSQMQIMGSIGGSISIQWPEAFTKVADMTKFAKV